MPWPSPGDHCSAFVCLHRFIVNDILCASHHVLSVSDWTQAVASQTIKAARAFVELVDCVTLCVSLFWYRMPKPFQLARAWSKMSIQYRTSGARASPSTRCARPRPILAQQVCAYTGVPFPRAEPLSMLSCQFKVSIFFL